MAPKSLPERSWGASGAEKKSLGTSKGALGEISSEISSKMKSATAGPRENADRLVPLKLPL